MATRQLSDKDPSGTVLGQSTTDKIGFYGLAVPIVQPAAISSATATATSAATTVNLVLARLRALNLIAT